MSNSIAIVVIMTAGSHDEAERIAELLVESRLAACVQIVPEIESVYWWDEKIERSRETLLFAKTTQDKFVELEAAVRAVHGYSTPEIIALPITAGSAPYLAWVAKNVSE